MLSTQMCPQSYLHNVKPQVAFHVNNKSKDMRIEKPREVHTKYVKSRLKKGIFSGGGGDSYDFLMKQKVEKGGDNFQ